MLRAREKVTNLMRQSTALSMVPINEPRNQTLNDELNNLKHTDKLYKNMQIVAEVLK